MHIRLDVRLRDSKKRDAVAGAVVKELGSTKDSSEAMRVVSTESPERMAMSGRDAILSFMISLSASIGASYYETQIHEAISRVEKQLNVALDYEIEVEEEPDGGE